MQNTFYPMLKGIDFVYVLWSLRYHTIYAIRTILYHHRMPLNRMEWHQIESNGMEWNAPYETIHHVYLSSCQFHIQLKLLN